MRKRSPKPLQNGAQDGPKSSPEGKTRGKWEKCKNEQRSMALAWCLVPRAVENQKKNHQTSVRQLIENVVEFQTRFLKEFC